MPASQLAQSAQSVDGTQFVSYSAAFDSMKDLQSFARALRAELGAGVIALALEADEPQIFVTVSDDLVARGVSAGALVSHGAPLLDGRGGGRPEMAQARGTRRDRLPSALSAIREALQAALHDGTTGKT
jgi:alanyl-tRNA synthetase